MHLRTRLRRRPSASMLVAVTALFVALGGVGYAASTLPSNSVGTAQLRNGSVTNWKLQNGAVGNWKLKFGAVGARKIIDGAVGRGQINVNQVQARVSGTCPSGAVSAIDAAGKVTCSSTAAEFDTSSTSPVTVGDPATTIAGQPLAGGSTYLVTANPEVTIAPGTGTGTSTGSVEVDCTLAAGPSTTASQTRKIVVDLGATPQSEVMPLAIAVPSNPTAISTALSCVKKVPSTITAAPAVTVSAGINALQTSSNTTQKSTG